MKGFPDLPPIWALGTAIAIYLLARFLPLLRFEWPILAALFFWGGLALIFWSAIWFWRKETPIEPHHAPRALIIEGPYRLNRNPIYTGLTILLFGYALGQGGLSGLLPVAIFPFIITQRFVLGEEAALRTAFGPEAEEWITETRRWI